MNVQSGKHGMPLITCEIKEMSERRCDHFDNCVEHVSVSVLCSACDLNVKMFMFRSHQWALPGWHTTLWRYSPSVFSSFISRCHFLHLGMFRETLRVALLCDLKHPAQFSSQRLSLIQDTAQLYQTLPFRAALNFVCRFAAHIID